MSLRACVLTSAHPAFDIRIFYKECRSLAHAGYDVTLVAPHTRDENVDGVSVKAVPRARGRLDRMTRTVWRIYRKAVSQSADIYHFHDPELIPVGLLMRVRGKRVIYDIHEDLPKCMPYKPYLPKWLGSCLVSLVEFGENAASRCFSALVPATPGIASRFLPLNKQTIVVHNYPIAEELAPKPERPWDQRAMAVAYIGSAIAERRGAIEMIEAMGLLPADFPATLELAGPFSPVELESDLSARPGWKRVRSHGLLGRKGVADLMSSVRAGLVVEHPMPNHLNSKPVKLFEYMAAGIPVIASDFDVWREIIDGAGCGLLVDPMNPSKIAEAIRYVLTHPKEAEEMGRRGREAVEQNYNWAIEQGKLVRLYANFAKTLRGKKQ